MSVNVYPERAEADWPLAVIACGHQTGVVLARNLERRGVRVIIVDSNPHASSFRSVYGTTRLCPNPDTHSREWLEFMLALSRELGGQPALIAAADQFVSSMGLYANVLKDHFRISRSAPVQAELALKEGQFRYATQHGLPIPLTRPASSVAGVEAFANVCTYPCLFKPQQHRYWEHAPLGHLLYMKKVVIAANRQELLEKYRIACEYSSEVTLSEMIVGPDTNKRVHVSLYGRDGARLGCYNTKVLRSFPMSYGVPSIAEPVDDPEVDKVSDRFFRNLGYHGICEIEFKRDSRTGKLMAMDINPRYSGGGDAMPYGGLDHGWMHYVDLIGKPVKPAEVSYKPFRHVMLGGDAAAVFQYLRAGDITMGEVWRSYRAAPLKFYDLDWHDRRLAMETLTVVFKVAALSALRRMGLRH